MSADMTGGGFTHAMRNRRNSDVYIYQPNDPSPVLCAGDSVYLQAGINTAEDLGPLDYAWSSGGDVQTELVNLDTTTTVVS